MVIEQLEAIENIPIDWLVGLAIDWISGNMYWADPKRNLIEVSRLNGSSRYVVVAQGVEKPAAICVDPVQGFLFWSANSKLEKARLDGSDQKVLINESVNANDIALDYENQLIYWVDSVLKTIEVMDYNGANRRVILNKSLDYPFAITVFQNVIYWIDLTHDKGE